MSDGPVPFVLCARPDQVPASVGPPPPGSKLRPCHGCGAKVVCGPATLAEVRAGRMSPVCFGCYRPARHGRTPVMTAAQARELTSWLGADPKAN
jgi:hypothetical protein